MKISLCMIVKNEEEKLSRCLDSVQGIVDEIIIVDTGSTDNTKEIASKYNAKIFDFIWNNNFSEARNYSLLKSTGDWNLVLDADEYIKNDSKKEIKYFIENNNSIGRICIIDKFVVNDEMKKSKVYLSRLFPNKKASYQGEIHEQLVSSLNRINTNIIVEHDGYIEDNKTEGNLPLLLKLHKKNLRIHILTTKLLSNII